MPKIKLPSTIKSLEEVPEKYREDYEKQADGTYSLTLDVDSDAKERLNEFRENNRKLKKENDELLAKYKDVDPAAYQAALEAQKKLREAEEKGLLDKGKIDEVFEARLVPIREAHTKALRELQEAKASAERTAATFRNRLGSSFIQTQTLGILEKLKVKPIPGALDDIIGRVQRVFRADDDVQKLVPVDENALDTNGDPLRLETYFKTALLEGAPHLFEGGGGGDGKGGDGKRVPRGERISGGDPDAFGANLEKIAGGQVTVI